MLYKHCHHQIPEYHPKKKPHTHQAVTPIPFSPSNQQSNFYLYAATAAKSLQSCLTLCDPMDCSPPGSSVPGILQARILEWVAISFSNA